LSGGGKLRQAKFAAVGVLNSLVDFIVFNLLTALLGMPVIPASVVAYCSGILNSYIFNVNWTFSDTNAKSDKALVTKFIVTNLVGMTINGGLVLVATHFLSGSTTWDQVWVLATAKVLATMGTLLISYTLMRRWVFVSAR
jgi:putative flippase GtrA